MPTNPHHRLSAILSWSVGLRTSGFLKKILSQGHIYVGRRGELAAIKHLKRKYYYILDKNWRIAAGEIDLVARDGRTLVFLEVKTRGDKLDPSYSPLAAVDYQKQRKLLDLAENYLSRNRLQLKRNRILRYRFDTMAVIYQKKRLLPFFCYQVQHHKSSFSFDLERKVTYTVY